MQRSSSLRILVADSFEPWRRYVSSVLAQDQSLLIVGVASDGLEAVQKAIELAPDLVLLSVALPKLNGIEAVKKISQAAPGVKLLFATQMVDADVMAKALGIGAHGCIWKMNAQTELLAAISAIRRGEKFVSSLKG